MAHKSLRETRRDLRRLLHTDRFVDALLVVEGPDGTELLRVGGRWDNVARRYVAAEGVRPHVRRLKRSQREAGAAIASWLAAARRRDPEAPILLMLAGARASGKTWMLGLLFVVIGLEFPNEHQFGVNITSDQRRECIAAIFAVARPEWIVLQIEDSHSPQLVFLTRNSVHWYSSRNAARLRQALLPIRHVAINEGQDQPETVYTNGIAATRNLDGLTSVATNRSQREAGDWVAVASLAIQGGEIAGVYVDMDPRLNDAVAKHALDKRANAIRAVSPAAAAADCDPEGAMKLSGPIAYPSFKPLPLERGGNLGDPPLRPQIGRALWRDVTRERTADEMRGGDGYDWVIGVDWQRRPGIVGVCCKLFVVERVWEPLPHPPGTLIMWAGDTVFTPGDESAFSQVLYRAGYTPQGVTPEGTHAPSALLVGDGTGATQNAAHNWQLPPSYPAMKKHGGWIVIPPAWTVNRKPDNPRVKESRPQMYAGFDSRQIIVSPRLKEADEGFPALIESLRIAKVTARGALIEKGGNQHGPDGLRYLWWKFGPRVLPPRTDPKPDLDTFNALASVQPFGSE